MRRDKSSQKNSDVETGWVYEGAHKVGVQAKTVVRTRLPLELGNTGKRVQQ